MPGPKWLRVMLVVFVGVGGIAGIGVCYNHHIQPNEPVWADDAHWWPYEVLPLQVWLTPELRAEYDVSVKHAIKNWNRSTCKLFEYRTELPEENMFGAVIIRLESVLDSEKVATTWLRITPAPVRAFIRVHRVQDIRAMMFGFEHELGHVLGLAHDPRPFSLMYALVVDLADSSPMPLLTSKDAAAIKERFCKDG